MSLEHAPSRQRRVNNFTCYLTKDDVCIRYGWTSKISVDRAWKEYRTLPPPDLYKGRRPLWGEKTLDAHDAAHKFNDT